MTKAEFRRWVDMINAEIVLPLAWASGRQVSHRHSIRVCRADHSIKKMQPPLIFKRQTAFFFLSHKFPIC